MNDIKQGFHFDPEAFQANDEWVEQKTKEQEELRKKEEQRKLEEHYRKESGAPARFFEESLDTYVPSEANKRLYDWLKGFIAAVQNNTNSKNIVFISGQRGTGKTHLGCGITKALKGRIITSFELCITYDSCRDFNSPMTRIQYLKSLCNEPVLVIDEVTKGIESIEKMILPFIVNEFYGSKKVLIFLGNCSKESFDKIISEDGVDRMNEVGVYFSLVGESMRGKK